MKRSGIAIAAVAVGLFLSTDMAWSSRMGGDLITGAITATPIAGQIEVEHHTYQIKSKSLAADHLRSLNVGDLVDLILDGPANGKNSEVVSIAPHSRT